ncbi:DUF2004 domain-containing protein [Motilimonas pumila]|uniref:DUF2004 domain-containing protein n=1 Tax=Motilimonas pumila TaxID=2303987 RepID=A0A418YGC8_9GAMM|nr:DUF2004 domain-containing protein [Motilimonas pumila]RJG48638.1 DUF2004 domain-containing protein [Motilimonas pumila]
MSQALNAIEAAIGTEQGEYSIDLFISHHLNLLSEDDWQQLIGKPAPSAKDMIASLDLVDQWEQTYDFALLNQVSDYLLSVTFDDQGAVSNIAMES